MKTGKLQSNYVMYSVEWAVRIIAGDSKCTLEKAYSIDRMFGVMVEQRVNQYKKEIELAKNFSVMCGVYGEMRNEYEDFGKYLSEEVEFFSKHKFDWQLEEEAEMNANPGPFKGELDFGNFHYTYEDWKIEYDAYVQFETKYKEPLMFNKLISNKIANLIVKSGNLSLNYLNQMPKQLANNFKIMKQLAIDTASSVKFYNEQLLWDEYQDLRYSQTIEEGEEIMTFYDSQTQIFTNIIQGNNIEYHQTLNKTQEQIRRLLDD